MLKFYKFKKNPEIRKVADCWADGTNTGRVVAIIGQVKELVKEKIIFPENTKGNEENWLIIVNDEDTTIYEFSSYDEAKKYSKEHYIEWNV